MPVTNDHEAASSARTYYELRANKARAKAKRLRSVVLHYGETAYLRGMLEHLKDEADHFDRLVAERDADLVPA